MPDQYQLFEFTRFYLAVFFTAVAVFYSVRVVVLKARLKNEVIFPGTPYCSTWWTHALFRIFRASIWLICVLRCIFSEVDHYLFLFPHLQRIEIIFTGIILLTLGFLATVSLHMKLGAQWRSGIDPNNPTQLLTTGVYGVSRNPMFLAIGLSQLGFFLAMPSLFSAACLVIGLCCLAVQTNAEEKHLSVLLPKEYQNYCKNVRRWL